MACSIDMATTERTSFQTNFRNALNGIVLSFRNPTTKYKVWSDLRKQCINGAKRSREVAKVILEKRQKDINASCSTPDDMLSYVFKLKEVLPGCNIEDLIDMVVTLVFGGMVSFYSNAQYYQTLLNFPVYFNDDFSVTQRMLHAERIDACHVPFVDNFRFVAPLFCALSGF